MTTVPAKDYVDARVSEAIAIQRADMARMDAKIDGLIVKIDSLPSFKAMLITGITIAFTALGILYAGMQYGAGTYAIGLTAAPVVEQALQNQSETFETILSSQAKRDALQDAQLNDISSKLDRLIEAVAHSQ